VQPDLMTKIRKSTYRKGKAAKQLAAMRVSGDYGVKEVSGGRAPKVGASGDAGAVAE
jgi:hypothetical protein